MYKRQAKGGSFEEKAAAYKAAMEQKEDLTARLRGKNYQKLDSNPNITVIDGTASFQSPHVVEVEKDGRTFQVEGEQIFINTGSSAFIPPIEEMCIRDSTRTGTIQAILKLELIGSLKI